MKTGFVFNQSWSSFNHKFKEMYTCPKPRQNIKHFLPNSLNIQRLLLAQLNINTNKLQKNDAYQP